VRRIYPNGVLPYPSQQRDGPAPMARDLPSLCRIPDDGVDVFVVLTGGAAEVGIKLLGAEGWIREAQRDVILAGRLSLLGPTGADFDGLAVDPIVGLGVAALGRVERDVDGRRLAS
jgi:hypothetical protein